MHFPNLFSPLEIRGRRIPNRVALQLPRRFKTMLQHISPLPAPLVITTKCRERHPQITRWKDAHLFAQSTRGTAIVGDGDHRSYVHRQAAQRREASEQPVPPTERDDFGLFNATHSRPKSR